MSRMRVFIPRNFTIEENGSFVVEKCVFNPYSSTKDRSYHKVISSIDTFITLSDAEIYFEGSKAEFLDRLDSSLKGKEALLV